MMQGQRCGNLQDMMAIGKRWPVVIIGAGVAGLTTAIALARHDISTLLIEKQKFPRDKLCGGCMGPRAVQILKQLQLQDVLSDATASPKTAMHWRAMRPERQVKFDMPGGWAVRRREFDLALAEKAMARGVHFLDQTSAKVTRTSDNQLTLTLQHQTDASTLTRDIQAEMVVYATGLNHHLPLPESPEILARSAPQPSRRSLIGVGTILEDADWTLAHDAIHMFSHRQGYAGVAAVGNGAWDVAAAVKPSWLKAVGGPGAAVNAILRQMDIPEQAWSDVTWYGASGLTQRRVRLAGHRTFVVGDAAGYVEPFTGEGMTWAMEQALAITPLIEQALRRWEPALISHWSRIHRRIMRPRHLRCHMIARLLRLPGGPRMAQWVLHRNPMIRSVLARTIHRQSALNAAPKKVCAV